MGILGRTRPDTGSLPATANGAMSAGRVAVMSSLGSDGQMRAKQGAASQDTVITNVERFLGITAEDIADGKVGEIICVPGQRVRAVAGAAIAADKRLTFDANGKLIEYVHDVTKFGQVVGYSVEAAAGDLSEFAMVIDPQFVGPASSSGVNLTLSGDIAAAGGFRRDIGPWVQDNVAASQAAVALAIGATAAPQRKWVARRAGSITGISASLTVAAAGSTAHVIVRKNGVPTTVDLSLSAGVNGGLKNSLVVAKDTVSFVANDDLDVTITTDGAWTATTADLAVSVEVEE